MKYTGRFGTFTVRSDQVDYYAPKVKAQKKKRAQASRGLAEWLELYKTCLNGCGRPVAFYDTVHYALRYSGCCSPECDAERQRKLEAERGKP